MPKVEDRKKAPEKEEEAKAEVAAPAPLQTAGLEDVDESLNGLWYGPEGTGKTTDVAHMAHEGRVLFINAEAGLKRRPLVEHGVPIENIRLFPDPRTGEQLTFDLVESMYWQMKSDLEDDPTSWAGTVWDSGTEIYKKLLDQIVEYQVNKAVRAGKDRDRFFIDRADYGVMSEQLRLLLRRFRDLPCHFAVTALERRDQDHDGKVVYGPAVTPALQSDLMGYVDVVIRTDVETNEATGEADFRGQTRRAGKYRAKDRFKVLPFQMVDPSFTRVLKYVNDEIDEESDELQQAANARREEEAKAEIDKGGE